MKLIIESTDVLTTIDGVQVRLWRGTTEGNRSVDVFVHRVGANGPEAQAELDGRLEDAAIPAELEDVRVTLAEVLMRTAL